MMERKYKLLLNRYILGPRPDFLLATLFMIVFPYMFFVYHEGHILWNQGFYFLMTTQAVFFALAISTLTITAVKDPGICMPDLNLTEIHDDFRSDFIVENMKGIPMQRKWCRTCRHYRPLRVRHCKEVDMCIKRFCHFCPWTNNAIGIRNHRYFVLFLVSTCVLCFKTLTGILIVAAYSNKSGDVQGFFFELFSPIHRYIVLIYTLTIGATLTHLVYYQFKLISMNITTAEDIKGDFRNGNPFSATSRENIKAFWLHPLPDSELFRINGINQIPGLSLGQICSLQE